MRELLLAAVILMALMLFGAMAALPWSVIFVGGAGAVIFGMALGLPAGFVYHVKLRSALLREGEVPKGWYWRPFAYHENLNPISRRKVLFWGYLGGAGFIFILLGIVAITTAVLAELT